MRPSIGFPSAVRPVLLLWVVLLGSPALSGQSAAAQKPDAPYVPTPAAVVSTMLELAAPTSRDTLYDLGSGDGRLVVAAADRYGTSGVGVEIQPRLNEMARRRAREKGVADRVRFVERDLFEVDLSPASVLILYLGRQINLELRPRILRQLRPGSRVVSHAFDMEQWKPDSLVQIPEEIALVYLWVVPANVGGLWRAKLPSGEEVTLRIDQRFQELRVEVVEGPADLRIEDPGMRGDGLWLTLVRDGREGADRRTEMVGIVQGDRIYGSTGIGDRWRAIRDPGTGGAVDAWDEDGPERSTAPERTRSSRGTEASTPRW